MHLTTSKSLFVKKHLNIEKIEDFQFSPFQSNGYYTYFNLVNYYKIEKKKNTKKLISGIGQQTAQSGNHLEKGNTEVSS